MSNAVTPAQPQRARAHPRDGVAPGRRARRPCGDGRRHRGRQRRLTPARLPPLREPRRPAGGDGAPPRRARAASAPASWPRASWRPSRGSRRCCALWLQYVPLILPVARALEAAVITGDEGGAAWRDRMDDIHEAFRLAVERIDGEGRLAERLDGRRGGGLDPRAQPHLDLAAPGRRSRMAGGRLRRAHGRLDHGRGRRAGRATNDDRAGVHTRVGAVPSPARMSPGPRPDRVSRGDWVRASPGAMAESSGVRRRRRRWAG